MTKPETPTTAAGGSPLERGVGPAFAHANDGGAAYSLQLLSTFPARDQRRFTFLLYDQAAMSAATAAERERCAADLADTARHMRASAERLREYEGQELEARARELAATYFDGAATLCRVRGPNGQLTGRTRSGSANC